MSAVLAALQYLGLLTDRLFETQMQHASVRINARPRRHR